MNHKKRRLKLSRKTAHRISLIRNLSKQLINHETITTTLKKAKFFKPFLEKIITISIKKKINKKKLVTSMLGNKNKEVDKILQIAPKNYSKKEGGYVRIVKSGFRKGDFSPMAIIELV